MEYILPAELFVAGIPEHLVVNHPVYSKEHLLELIFKGGSQSYVDMRVFEGFISDLFKEFGNQEFRVIFEQLDFELSAENMKYILRSESLRQLIRANLAKYSISRPPFKVKLDELLKVVDEPVVPLADIIELDFDKYTLPKFKTVEQLNRLEILVGYPLSELLRTNIDYFKNRHIFKYMMESGQEILNELSENTRDLLKIDYPTLL